MAYFSANFLLPLTLVHFYYRSLGNYGFKVLCLFQGFWSILFDVSSVIMIFFKFFSVTMV